MFKFRFPHKPNAKTKQARRVFFVRKRTLAIPAGLAAVCALCLITTLPSYVSAASTQRQLPIYCVQREDNVCSLTFDAAWGMLACGTGLSQNDFSKSHETAPFLFARIKQQRIPRRKPVGMRCCFMMRLGSRVSFPCFARSAAALPCLGRLSAT